MCSPSSARRLNKKGIFCTTWQAARPRGPLAALLTWVLCWAAVASWGCDASPDGRLELTYQLASLEGAPLQCSDLGASWVEISLFHLPEDVLPYHLVSGPCETSEGGEGRLVVAVDAHRYARLEARLVTQAGTTVRFCRPPDVQEARFTEAPLAVSAGEIQSLLWRVEGAPGSCPAPPSPLPPAPH